MTEKDFQEQIVTLAHLYHYRVAHFRPAQTSKGWRTPVSADGKGFPDLCLVGNGRLIFAEVKSGKNKLSTEQWEWLEDLGRTKAEVYHWAEGKDSLEEIAEVLR